jgi:hypothetical protein
MGNIKFEFYPTFESDIYSASYKSRSSLRGLYDKVRSVTDEIRDNAIESLEGLYELAESQAQSGTKTHGESRKRFLTAKAKAFTFRSTRDTTSAVMGFDGKEIYGRVLMNRTDSWSIEFGGVDRKAEIGKGTGEYVTHPSYGILRKAMDRIE